MKPRLLPCDGCSQPGGWSFDRREFLKLMGTGAAALAAMPAVAGPFEASDFEKLVPSDKKLNPDWVKSLFARGAREVYRGPALEKIGMPIGGIGTGQLYLGGDGKLWHWDIFNKHVGTGDSHYKNPVKPNSPLDQGFALRFHAGGTTGVRTLDRKGFAEISFCGEYPLAFVEYRDPAVPVSVSLEAFSPFIPLNADDSNLPATVMRFTVKNPGAARVECELAGWLENAVCLHSGEAWQAQRRNRLVRTAGAWFLESGAEATPVEESKRPDMVFANFDGESYGEWKVEGEALGKGPAKGPLGNDQRLKGFLGRGLVNTYLGSDKFRGKLTSPVFTIERHFIAFLIGGGNHPGETCINLVVDGKTVRTATGKNSDAMEWTSWEVKDLAGQAAHLEIVDNHAGGWGHVDVDQIEFRDRPRGSASRLEEEPDYGTMGLALLDPVASDTAILALPAGHLAEEIFSVAVREGEVRKPFDSKLVGALKRQLTLEPGQSATITFVVAWHFPKDEIKGLKASPVRRYAARFPSAAAVVEYVAKNFASLAGQTRLWHDTWYESTLPYWFLDRTFLNTSILATSTFHWFQDNRVYGWEGVGCCAGTCTHVWHYAQAMGRIFPQLERSLRELTDYGAGFDADTGRIRFRAEHNNHWAVDGQAGTILRVYREHQMSADDQFLKTLWPRVKQSLQFLISKDEGADGVMDGPQHNTLDLDWWGQVAWLSGLYLAALRAGEEMARELGDAAFAQQCRAIFEQGRRNVSEKLFNGEYFIQRGDPAHAKTVGSYNGCEIDQVLGQSWAWQVALGRILDEDKVKTALRSLWRYNFTPDVGPYRAAYKPGRWYAMPGEGGLLMCTWPKGEASRVPVSFDYYFNECMNGFEYQVAGHMIREGLVQEGLAITRSVHDRYHPARRNGWNEVECGDHYARSMASYGVFLAACGYEYHGPKGHLGFAPPWSADHFQAAFTAAEGWGSFTQRSEGPMLQAEIAIKYGRLRLKTLALRVAKPPTAVQLALNGQPLRATQTCENGRLTITLSAAAVIAAGQKCVISVS